MTFAMFVRKVEGKEPKKSQWDFSEGVDGSSNLTTSPFFYSSILNSLNNFIEEGSYLNNAFLWRNTHQGRYYWDNNNYYTMFSQLKAKDQEYILALRDYWEERLA